MKILVTGANGYLGALLCAELHLHNSLIRTSQSIENIHKVTPLDVRNFDRVSEVFSRETPEVIIHAAANANVVACEKDPSAAHETNAYGTYNVVRAANLIGAKVVLISSLAAKNPTTVYGKSKLLAEQYVENVTSGYEILRLSMTFGLSPNTTSHRPYNKIVMTMKTGKPDTYDSSWRFHPTHTKHVLCVINKILERPFQGLVLNIATTESCTMHQLVTDVLDSRCIKGGALYCDRIYEFVDSNELSKNGFPTCSYRSMIDHLKMQMRYLEGNI